jgi:hypothetical protein
LRQEIEDGDERRQMRVRHEGLVQRISLIGEAPRRRWQRG